MTHTTSQRAMPDARQPAATTDYIAEELRHYDEHLRDVRGLAAGTRQDLIRVAGWLLQQKFAGQPIDIAKLHPGDIRQFLAEQLDTHQTASTASRLAGALRSCLRYRTTCGDQVGALAAVISSSVHWKLASLPRALKPEETERLLNSLATARRWPKRGYAIVRCALDLGLRCGEIAHLMISDIDWRAGTVALKGTKSLRQDVLPLPMETGQALADYLQHERPATHHPAIFVRQQAGLDRPITSTAISKLIQRAGRRVGLMHFSAHALRHTLACRLVENGSSLKEVADVLRHRSLNTTLIYRQARHAEAVHRPAAVARERIMSARISLQTRIDDYLAERRRLGFELRSWDTFLAGFARFVASRHHRGPLTVELMTDWIRQGKDGRGSPGTWARRLEKLRLFVRYLKQFEPDTEVPDESIFGPVPGRVAPHIYRDDEIVELLAAARQLGPHGSVRAATFETLFGLMASTGLRVSEAIHLRDADVDLKRGILTIRQTKFAKSRQVPIHPSTLEALARYRRQRAQHVPTTADMPFLIGSRGRRLGQPLGDRQAHRVFNPLRDSLGWVNRGAHAAPRLHDLRHTFAVRRVMRWHAEGADVDQMMLALSTYMGHAEIFYTYWYLTAVPELMALAGGKFEHFADLPGEGDE